MAVKKVWSITVPRTVAAPWPPWGRLRGSAVGEVRASPACGASLARVPFAERRGGLAVALLRRLLENIGS